MKRMRRRAQEPTALVKARKRVARMGTAELLAWADTAISGMGKGLMDWQRDQVRESLLEIRDEALVVMTALVDELLLRDEAARNEEGTSSSGSNDGSGRGRLRSTLVA